MNRKWSSLAALAFSVVLACSSKKDPGLHCHFTDGSCECDDRDSTANEEGYMPADAKECSAASIGPNGICCRRRSGAQHGRAQAKAAGGPSARRAC